MIERTQEQLDAGEGLYYIIQSGTNHRFRDKNGVLYVYDDWEVAASRAEALKWHGGCEAIMVCDYNAKFRKHMDTLGHEG